MPTTPPEVDLRELVAECLRLVFPRLSAQQARDAVQDELAEWDSLATVRLYALVQETLEVDLSPVDLPHFTSCREIAELLSRRGARPQP